MKRKEGFVLQTIGTDTFAVAVTPESAKIGSMIRLNATGAFLFRFLEEEHTEEECVQALLDAYEITREIAANDVARFLSGLREASLLA